MIGFDAFCSTVRKPFNTRMLLVGVLLAFSGQAQVSAPALRGTWTATAGIQTLHGSWGAETSPRNPDAAQGYWTLVNDAGERVLEGTWSAKKTGSRWQGTWTARTQRGRSFSGTWDADITESKAKTFADMLTASLEKEVSGSWQNGHASGNWWLKGSKTKNGGR